MNAKRIAGTAVTVILTAALLAPAAGRAQDAARKKVLLIGLDGVRVDVMAAVKTPVIDSLAASGFFSDEAQTRVRTVSGPGWSSMVIGARTEKHRVDSNNFEGNDYSSYPDFLSRIELKPQLFNKRGDVFIGHDRRIVLFYVEDLVRNTDSHVLLDLQLAGQADVVEFFLAAQVRQLGGKDIPAAFGDFAFAYPAAAFSAAGRGQVDAPLRQRGE